SLCVGACCSAAAAIVDASNRTSRASFFERKAIDPLFPCGTATHFHLCGHWCGDSSSDEPRESILSPPPPPVSLFATPPLPPEARCASSPGCIHPLLALLFG
ncbi:unnamed protein product, partial [Ectocarpus sp. 4 AP-2014]